MIRDLRKSIQGPVGKVLVVLFCIPFMLFGAEAFLAGGFATDKVGEINGEPVYQYQYESLFGRIAQEFSDSTEITGSELREFTENNLVQAAVFRQWGQNIGVELPESQLDNLVRAQAEFQRSGQFDPQRYATFARELGLTQASLRSVLAQDQLFQQLGQGFPRGMQGANGETLLYLWRQKREVSYLRIYEKDYIPAQLSEEELETFYSDHAELFFLPEEVDLKVVVLSTEELERRAAEFVEEEQVLAAYQAYLEAQTSIERRAAHIMVAELDQAQELYRQLQQGADFAALAKEHSLDSSAAAGGDVGFSSGDIFPEEFEAALAILALGAFSEPVVIGENVHLIQLTDLIEAEAGSYEDRAVALREELEAVQLEELKQHIQDQVEELAYSATEIEEIATAIQTDVAVFDAVRPGQSGRGIVSSPEIQAIAFSEELISDYFISAPLQLNDGGIALVQPIAYRPPTHQTFEQARSQVEQQLKELKAREQLDVLAIKIDEALTQGQSLKEIAAEQGIEEEVERITLTRFSENIAAEARDALFDLESEHPGTWIQVPVAGGLAWGVLKKAFRTQTDYKTVEQQAFLVERIESLRFQSVLASLIDVLEQDADSWFRSYADDPAQTEALDL
ncbi:MAG: SurA N-terminal domain-containing protein [Gammaproteobacteria bacterium]